MSFADDLNSVAKTPEQAAADERKDAIERGELVAKSEYESIKRKFKEMAANGQYRVVANKKYIEFELSNGQFNGLLKVHDAMHAEKQLFGFKETSEISFLASNADVLSGYLTTLSKLAGEDGISVKLCGRHQVNSGPVQYFDIPGKLVAKGYSANKVWTKAVLVCSMSF